MASGVCCRSSAAVAVSCFCEQSCRADVRQQLDASRNPADAAYLGEADAAPLECIHAAQACPSRIHK